MASLTIRCPECGAALNSAEAFQPGKLVDCPRCRLLFAPTPDEVNGPSSGGENSPANPSSSPWTARARRRPQSTSEMMVIFVATGVMLALAGVVIGTYVLCLPGPVPQPSKTQPTPTAPDPVFAPEVDGAKSPPAVEVEDPNPTPRRPVPRLDEPPKKGG